MLSLAAEQAPPRHQPVARAGDQLGVVRAEVEAGHLAGVLQRGQQVLLQPHPAMPHCLIFRSVFMTGFHHLRGGILQISLAWNLMDEWKCAGGS